MKTNTSELQSVVLGSFIITIGSTIAGIYSFNGNVGLVTIGFMIFTFGYLFSQQRLSLRSEYYLKLLESRHRRSLLFQITLLVVGHIAIGYGMTLFAQTILNLSVSNVILSGISTMSGYMCAHVGVNRKGLGESLLYYPIKSLLNES